MKAGLCLVIPVILWMLVAACDGDDVPEGRTGISPVDVVLDAIEADDAATVESLFALTSTACLRGALAVEPRCAEGELTGTNVDTFPVGACEGLSHRRVDVGPPSDLIVGSGLELYAVYGAPDGFYIPAEYVAVFSQKTPDAVHGVAVLLAEGRIAGIDVDCGFPPDELVEYLGLENSVLPPDQ